MSGVKKPKKIEKEDTLFFHEFLVPALEQLQASAEDWVPPPMPEFEGDPLDLTPEQEAEICRQIRRSRGHHDDSE
jgi:hypothetical protein